MLLMKGILHCDVQNSANNAISFLLFGAGFLPSTVDLGPTEDRTARKKRTLNMTLLYSIKTHMDKKRAGLG